MPVRVLAVVLVALLVAVPAARAQDGPWSEGGLEYTTGFSCTSIIIGSPRLVLTTGAGAAFEGSPQRIRPAGSVFYSRLTVAVVGDPCGAAARLSFRRPPGSGRAVLSVQAKTIDGARSPAARRRLSLR